MNKGVFLGASPLLGVVFEFFKSIITDRDGFWRIITVESSFFWGIFCIYFSCHCITNKLNFNKKKNFIKVMLIFQFFTFLQGM